MPLAFRRRAPAYLLLALLGVACGARALAQDVTITELEWAEPLHAPDQLPEVKHRPRVWFPDELKKTTDIGYILIETMLDEKGDHLSWRERPTNPLYLGAVDGRDVSRFRFSAARRDGEPVVAAVKFAILFNPAGAATAGPDATPRLLAAAAAHVRAPKHTKADIPDRIVAADMHVNEDGQVTAVDNVPPEYSEPIAIAAKNWRFAPARVAGKPAPAVVHVPFIVVTDDQPSDLHGKRTPPKVISRNPPTYPFAMRASGLRGEVLVDFVVTIEGRTRNAYVVRTLNPAFDDAALEAVGKWRFKPGVVNGVPVNTHMQVPIVFQLDSPDGGDDGTEIRRHADFSKLPPEFRYDKEPRLRAFVRPVYPYAALAAKREGRAVVRFIIDAQGRVVKPTVTEATSPEFGQAVLAAVSEFLYTPAVKDGHPSPALFGFEQNFSRDVIDGAVTQADLDVLYKEQKRPQTIVSARELDHPLKPLSRKPPVFPAALAENADHGSATIDFIIDDEGRARLPRIVTATDDAFGYAAAQAIAAWRFEPPTRGGHAVMTRVRIPVDFKLTPPPASPAPAAAAP